MRRRSILWVKIILAAIAFGLAVFREFFFDFASKRMDTVFLALILAVVLIFVLPWERLSSVKAVGIEITLDKPEVKAALTGLAHVSGVKDQQLREKLESLSSEIERANGGRILWINDEPYKIINERRSLRALGVQSILVTSSRAAEGVLKKDNDFDLIITDLKRQGNSYAGVNFIVKLRQNGNQVIRELQVIFYIGQTDYTWPEFVELTTPAKKLPPEAKLCNKPVDLIITTLRTLADARSEPITSETLK